MRNLGWNAEFVGLNCGVWTEEERRRERDGGCAMGESKILRMREKGDERERGERGREREREREEKRARVGEGEIERRERSEKEIREI